MYEYYRLFYNEMRKDRTWFAIISILMRNSGVSGDTKSLAVAFINRIDVLINERGN